MRTNDTKVQRQAIKGATVRQMGFETGIHALPLGVKQEIDKMIGWKYSPLKILSQIEKQFPSQPLPSKSALYNYRKRYFTNSISNNRKLSQAENELDIDKIKLKSVLLDQVKRFVAFDLPTIRERWINAFKRDEHLQLSGTKDIGRLYLDAVKLGLETIPKLNINLASVVESDEVKQEDEVDQEWIDNALLDLLNNRGHQIKVRLERRKSLREADRAKAIESQAVI